MILADTGFFVALVVHSDKHHAAAVAAARRHSAERLLTTWPVLTETFHVVQRVGGTELAQRWFQGIEAGAAKVFELKTLHVPRMLELMWKYRDLPMDLADASLVICAEQEGDGRIFSTDTRDFRAYRWKRRKPFRNLLPE